MPFADDQRQLLLAVRGVGPTVVTRLEQMGFASFTDLAQADADQILAGGAALTGSTCWKNSPQARAAIKAAIVCAQHHTMERP